MKKSNIAWVAGLVSGLWALSASATPITVAFQGFAHGSQIGTIAGVRNTGARAGEFKFNVTSGTFWDTTLEAFCIDVTTNLITSSSANYDLVSASSSSRLTSGQRSLIASLYDQHGSEITSGANSAAFQLALWEIVYDAGTRQLTSDNFSASAFVDSRNIAQGWLNGLNASGSYTSSKYQFYVLESPNNDRGADLNQSLLLVRPTSVPEPGTLALLGLGLVVAGIGRRFRKA